MQRLLARSSVRPNVFGALLERQDIAGWKNSLCDRTKDARRAAKEFVDRHSGTLYVAQAASVCAALACGLADSDHRMAVALGFYVATSAVEGIVQTLAPSPLTMPAIVATEHSLIVALARAHTAWLG